MKKYIIISFQKDVLVFTQMNEPPCKEEFINKNVIFQNKFVYTTKHYKKNINRVSIYIGKVIDKNGIKKCYVEDSDLVLSCLQLIKNIKITNLFIRNFKSLKLEECNQIISNKYLTYINCYYIPYVYLVKMKDQKRKINLNYQESISDNFMITQDVIDSEALYYKRVLHFDEKYCYKEKDFQEFLKLNIYLKTIHIHVCDKKVLESIIKVLKKDSREHIVILLYQGYTDFIEKNFAYLKNINKNYRKELLGDIRIVYSSNFVKNNLFKQLTYNNVKMSSIIVLYVLIVGLIFTELYNYVAQLNVEKLNYYLYAENNQSTSSISSMLESSIEETPQVSKYKFEKSFIALKKINSDVVGWITVNNTSVDYPVVQSTNNDYYLKHDIYKSWTSQGWVFMDYRNNTQDLDDNTILYGHKLKNGLMFGTLSDTLKKSWYTDENNQIITFDIPSTNMKWKIFSIYKTEYTTDYLVTNFINVQTYEEFINMIKNRSIYDFKVDVKYGDKILTLSTCIGTSSSNNRMVIHAKLIE